MINGTLSGIRGEGFFIVRSYKHPGECLTMIHGGSFWDVIPASWEMAA